MAHYECKYKQSGKTIKISFTQITACWKLFASMKMLFNCVCKHYSIDYKIESKFHFKRFSTIDFSCHDWYQHSTVKRKINKNKRKQIILHKPNITKQSALIYNPMKEKKHFKAYFISRNALKWNYFLILLPWV